MPPLVPTLVLSCALVFWVWCIVDYSRTDPARMRNFTPLIWLVVLVLGSVAGGIAWVIGGRPQPRA